MQDKVQEAAEKLAVEERNEREETVNKQVEAIWEQLVLRRLVTHVGMRSPEIISTQESTLFFQNLFDQIITIQQLDPKTHTLDHVFEFVLKFSTRIPSILSRAIMMVSPFLFLSSFSCQSLFLTFVRIAEVLDDG